MTTDLRQYREAHIVSKEWQVHSVVWYRLYMMMGDKEGGAEIACVLLKKTKLKCVQVKKNMVKQSPTLNKYITKRKSDMFMERTFSTFAPLGK